MTDLTVFGLRLAALADSTPELRAGLLLAALIAIDEGLQGDQPCKHDCQGCADVADNPSSPEQAGGLLLVDPGNMPLIKAAWPRLDHDQRAGLRNRVAREVQARTTRRVFSADTADLASLLAWMDEYGLTGGVGE